MKPINPENTEVALGLRRIDIRTASRSVIDTNQPELELRVAKAYWLKTIQPYIAGRKLRGVELFIAQDQYRNLKGVVDYAIRWNDTEEGKNSPVPAEAFPDWEQEDYQEPEELIADENLKPAILAGIAANLVKSERTEKTPNEAVREAHELLIAAERYISALPKRVQFTDPVKHSDKFLEPFYARVTFEEILNSNEKNSGRIPLLPPVQKGRNEGRLTMNALKTAIKRFLQDRAPTITQEEFEREERDSEMALKKSREDYEKSGRNGLVGKMFRIGSGKTLTYQEWQKLNQSSINDILENNRISTSLISVMRWERFKDFSKIQQIRAENRRAT